MPNAHHAEREGKPLILLKCFLGDLSESQFYAIFAELVQHGYRQNQQITVKDMGLARRSGTRRRGV